MTLTLRLLKIGWRNILRQKRRTFLALAILVLGGTSLLLVRGFFEDLLVRFRETYIRSQSGHLQISAMGYFEKGVSAPFDYLLSDVSSLQKTVESFSHVRFTVPRIKFTALASFGDTSVGIQALGVDPERERRMGAFKNPKATGTVVRIVQGEDLDPADPDGIVVGEGLFKILGLKVGDSLVLMTRRPSGSLEGGEYRVRGAYRTSVKSLDDKSLKIPLGGAQQLLGIPNQAHSLLAILDETEATDGVRTELETHFLRAGLSLEAVTWERQAQYYLQSRALFERIYQIIQWILALVFFSTVANALNMALSERMREFGTMMALGNARGIVFSLLFLEAIFIGLIGATLALGLGEGLARLITAVGIEMPPPPQGANSYIAGISLKTPHAFQVWLMTIFSTILASLVPGWRASRIPITKALGYV